VSFADRWSRRERLRGILARLPAEDVTGAAATAGLDFVAIDLHSGPVDELALARVVTIAHAAGLGVIAVAAPSERLFALGADAVVGPGDPTLRVVARVDAVGDDDGPVAIDLVAVVSATLDAFAGDVAPDPLPLVLLPGMLGSARVFADVVADLGDAVSCRPLRVDLDETVADAAESVLAAAPGRFALAGHSLGGIVALAMWARAPHRIARLALLNSSARPPSPEQRDAWSDLRERTARGDFGTVVAEQARINVGDQPAGRGDLVRRWIDIASDVGPEGLQRQLSMQASRDDSRQWLGSIDVPTLVLSGAADRVCPPEIQAEIVAAVPCATHVTIEGAGHMTPLDHPAEVAAALRGWLASPVPASVRRMQHSARPS
jgi:pimeloyl-ACP methyl ester carboxylesterase